MQEDNLFVFLHFFKNLFCLIAVLSILTVKTPAVSSRRGDEVLKAHAPSGARRKQLLVLCIRTGLRPSRDTAFCFSSLSPSCFFSGFCLFLWLAVPWTSEQRTPPCTTATLLSRPLSCSFLPGLPTTCCCECSRRPWGMCLSLLPSGAFSHISPPPRASIGLELAFTQTWRTPFFGAVRFPASR